MALGSTQALTEMSGGGGGGSSSSSGQPTNGGPPALGLVEVLTSPHGKKC